MAFTWDCDLSFYPQYLMVSVEKDFKIISNMLLEYMREMMQISWYTFKDYLVKQYLTPVKFIALIETIMDLLTASSLFSNILEREK